MITLIKVYYMDWLYSNIILYIAKLSNYLLLYNSPGFWLSAD